MRLACIDIGSNTTRLLVADARAGGLVSLAEERAFTSLGRALELTGHLPPGKLDEVLEVVARQLRRARELGVGEVHAVATAAVRRASNGNELIARLHRDLGLVTRVLSPAEEARIAFIGAAANPATSRSDRVAVVDVGGGSCELAVGRAPDDVEWTASLPVGSGTLTARFLHEDPPTPPELDRARQAICEAADELDIPAVQCLLAVGGSATSLRRIGGDRLEQATLELLLTEATRCSHAERAARLGLELERAQLLPAGLLILGMLVHRFGQPMQVALGGLREGVLIEAARV